MTVESLLIILLVGVIAGWLAGLIVQGTGLGKRWPEPTDATAPFIESIEVKVTENGSAANETKH